jgi:hypothetical protein
MAFIEFQDVSGSFKAGVEDIGTGDVDLAFEGVEKEIVDWCNEQILLFRKQIKGNLQGSMVPIPMKRFGKEFFVEIVGASYWKLLEYGQKGTEESTKAPNSPFTVKEYPRLEDMVKWVQFKSLASGKKDVYSFASQVRRSIYKKGTYAHPFVQPTLTENRLNDLTQRVAEMTAQAFTAVLLPD